MYLFSNPVLQRELLVNLRTTRSFVLLLAYQALLATVVILAWPQQSRLEPNAAAARGLVDLVFLGQFLLASLMAPSFAAGSITGEKERKTYEMLLASPLRPLAIVIGKLLASLSHIAILIFSSLPIVLLCLPLGGVSLYEVIAAYVGLLTAVLMFGTISVACSSYFSQTMAALIVSYLVILPLALCGALIWLSMSEFGATRLFFVTFLLPVAALALCVLLVAHVSERMLHPPDVGSEGKDVLEPDEDADNVMGLVIRRDQFPDRLFAPPKRTDLLPDHSNPIYDKEIQAEIFSQGTLMLRLVIQISMFLAIPLMACFIFIFPGYVAWYIAYVLTFTLLVSPVFLAGSITGERERQTLDLLLTTNLRPSQFLWGKTWAGLRVAAVLTAFLLWPVFLGCVLVSFYWSNMASMLAYVLLVFLTCALAAVLALLNSVYCRNTGSSLITTYLILIVFCFGPPAFTYFARTFHAGTRLDAISSWVEHVSPYAVAFRIPLDIDAFDLGRERALAVKRAVQGSWSIFMSHCVCGLTAGSIMLAAIDWLFARRWRVSQADGGADG